MFVYLRRVLPRRLNTVKELASLKAVKQVLWLCLVQLPRVKIKKCRSRSAGRDLRGRMQCLQFVSKMKSVVPNSSKSKYPNFKKDARSRFLSRFMPVWSFLLNSVLFPLARTISQESINIEGWFFHTILIWLVWYKWTSRLEIVCKFEFWEFFCWLSIFKIFLRPMLKISELFQLPI